MKKEKMNLEYLHITLHNTVVGAANAKAIGTPTTAVGGKEDGAQSGNTNVVFDLFNDKDAKGLTELKLANQDGVQTERYNVDQSKITKDTKAELRISIDPTIHTTKTGFAVALNHEGSVHGAGLLKALSVLRDKGGADFLAKLYMLLLLQNLENQQQLLAQDI